MQLVLPKGTSCLATARTNIGSIDVQCSTGEHCMLRYVTGYVPKASNALRFGARDNNQGQGHIRRHVYRLMCRKSPMEQEMVMEFAGVHIVVSSFLRDSIYAPEPGSSASITCRDKYRAYLEFWAKPATTT